MKRRRHEPLEEEAEINMTPMLDIVFIMLIFFVVASSFIKESGVQVTRPAAGSAVRKEHGNIMIAITRDDEIWIDRQRVDPHAVQAQVDRLHAENPEGTVVIQADRNSRSGLLVRVIDQARSAGVEDVAIAAEAKRD